jgi:hypothetical protein
LETGHRLWRLIIDWNLGEELWKFQGIEIHQFQEETGNCSPTPGARQLRAV